MSYFISLSGLKAAQTDLDVISNNIANSETYGFKRAKVNFDDVIAASVITNQRTTIGLGVTVGSLTRDFSVGGLEQTGSALDLAVGGDGFFSTVSQINGQTLFTRKGEFQLDAAGFITDAVGNHLQIYGPGVTPGSGSPIDGQVALTNPAGSAFSAITVSTDGTVTSSYADGSNAVVGKVALASFTAPQSLKSVGASNYIVTGDSGVANYGAADAGAYGAITSGTLERSNVDISEELVNLITAQRYFQANAKAIDTATEISQTIINLHN